LEKKNSGVRGGRGNEVHGMEFDRKTRKQRRECKKKRRKPAAEWKKKGSTLILGGGGVLAVNLKPTPGAKKTANMKEPLPGESPKPPSLKGQKVH